MIFNNNEIKLIIFDLDGTLFDSCKMWHNVDINFFKKRNMELPLDYSKEIAHLGLDKAASYTKNRFNLKESEETIKKEWKEQAIFEYANNVFLKPYVKEYLSKLKDEKIILTIATANSEEFYMPCLKNNNIKDYFDFISDVNQFKGTKDNPEIYLRISNKYGIEPKNIIVFEDIPLALKTAKNAGFNTVAVDDETEQDLKEEKIKIANKYIYSYCELLN